MSVNAASSAKNTSPKTRLAVICGGQSGEHEISLLSAHNVLKAIDKAQYACFAVGIEKNGTWAYYPDRDDFLINPGDPRNTRLDASKAIPATIIATTDGPALVRLADGQVITLLDVAFPVLHGPYGEDGTIQGMFKLAGLPCVGCSTLSASMTMDKEITKRLLQGAGIPTPQFMVFRPSDAPTFAAVRERLGLPFFVKPANAGSSLGISRVMEEKDFASSLKEAFRHDSKILIEQAIVGREIECAVLGNEDPRASLPGEIIPDKAFYSYAAKYLTDDGARLEMPAKLSSKQIEHVQQTAIQAYKALCCEGMARVDFFLAPDNKLYVNEINTIPGFTNISMYPKLWDLTGIPYPVLINELIQLALSRS